MDKENDDDEIPKDEIPEYVTFGESRDEENKYAIYAYTHGPVTGSGPSVVWP